MDRMDPELEARLREAAAELDFDPYDYTPFRDPLDSDDSSTPSTGPSEPPAGNGDDGLPWCRCGRCESMPTPEEDVCCRSMPEVLVVCQQDGGCITIHPAFQSVCLTPEVLRAVHIALEEEGANIDGDGDVNK
uniref:P2X purinoreceptor 7 intracellular domain-containing protein n=1 Tax=Amblyomma triste TaxID=251400 RepID=A0A023GA32_AMBTT